MDNGRTSASIRQHYSASDYCSSHLTRPTARWERVVSPTVTRRRFDTLLLPFDEQRLSPLSQIDIDDSSPPSQYAHRLAISKICTHSKSRI